MNSNWKEILKKVINIIGRLLLTLGILYVLVLIILSLLYRPMGVKVTNVTSSSATVTWYTSVPMTGVVKYKEKDSFLPWVFGGISSRKAYDDRDFANAQTACVEMFNKKIEKEVDSEFTVSGEDFDCENIKVNKIGRYYVHHVTIKGLKESSQYHFRVGDRLWSWKGETSSLTTYETPNSVKEPMPIFGRIVSSEGNYSPDSIIFTKFKNNKGETSIEYSSVTNNEGGWYIDGGNLRSTTGEIMEMSSSEDSFTAYGRYKASGNSESVSWVFGTFDGAYPDLEVKYTERDNWLYKFVFGVSADSCTDCDVNVIGYGNCAKRCARENGGALNSETLKKMGLCSDDNPAQCAGNFSAITGQGVTGNSWEENEWEAKVKRNDPNNDEENGYWSDIRQNTANSGSGSNGGSSGTSGTVDTNNGQITFTASPSGAWSLNVGGYVIEDKEDIKKILGYEDGEAGKGSLVSQQIDGCVSNISFCNLVFEPVEINLLELIKARPEIIEGMKKGQYNVPNFVQSLKDIVEQKGLVGHDLEAAKRALNSLQQVAAPISPTLPEGFVLEPDKKFVGDNITKEWLELFNSGATAEDKRIFALKLGVDPAELEGKDLSKIVVKRDGTVFAVSIDGWFLESFPIRDFDTGVPLSNASLEKMYGGLSNLPNTIVKNNSPQVLFTSAVNKELIEEVNKLSDKDKIALMKSLGLTPPSSNEYLVSQGINVTMDLSGNIQFSYVDAYSRPQKTKKISKQEFASSNSLINILGGQTSSTDSVIVIDSKSDNYKDAEEYLYPVSNQDLGNIVSTSGQNPCLNGSTCSQSDANSFATTLNKEKGSSYPGTFIVVSGFGNNGERFKVLYIPTENELSSQEKYLTGELNEYQNIIDELENSPGSFLWRLIERASIKTYADGKKVSGQGSVFFLPEYGLFSLQLGEFEFEKEISDGLTFYIFYLETNGKKGFQMPKNPDKPTIHEDRILRSQSFEINYVKKAEVRKYDLTKGINIISFDFIPVPPSKSSNYSARDIIENARRTGTRVEYVSYFDGGRWVDGYKCTEEACVGSNFTILPGRGYLLKAANKGSVSISAYNLKSAIPLNLSAGWNLVGVHGYNKAYTAKTLINSINKVKGLTADNVSWYPTSKGKYEGLQLTDGVEYGFDYPINSMNGYFVKIREFKPEDNNCKSIIWHEGNELHGKCGDSKSLF